MQCGLKRCIDLCHKECNEGRLNHAWKKWDAFRDTGSMKGKNVVLRYVHQNVITYSSLHLNVPSYDFKIWSCMLWSKTNRNIHIFSRHLRQTRNRQTHASTIGTVKLKCLWELYQAIFKGHKWWYEKYIGPLRLFVRELQSCASGVHTRRTCLNFTVQASQHSQIWFCEMGWTSKFHNGPSESQQGKCSGVLQSATRGLHARNL